MSSPLTVAWTGNSHTAALILKGLLTSVGIPAQVAGEELTDEFAQANRMSGGLGQILVPKNRLEEAVALDQVGTAAMQLGSLASVFLTTTPSLH